MPKHRLFLSYCRCDAVEAGRLREDLMAEGFGVWWDQDILGGRDWKHEIREAMRGCNAVILCFSSECLERERSGIYPEALDAIAAYRECKPGSAYIFPIRFTECEIPRIEIDGTRTLDRIQYLDLFPPRQREERIRRVAKSIRTALSPSATSRRQPEKPRPKKPGGQTCMCVITCRGDRKELEAIMDLVLPRIRELSGDYGIEIVEVKDGSIKLVLRGTREGIEALKALFESGQLTEICNFAVEAIELLPAERAATRPPARSPVALLPDDRPLRCRICGSSIERHQPQIDNPERQLGTCEGCGTWYLLDSEACEADPRQKSKGEYFPGYSNIESMFEIFNAREEDDQFLCRVCGSATHGEQPDMGKPDLLLKVCDSCGSWYIVNEEIFVAIKLPDWRAVRDVGMLIIPLPGEEHDEYINIKIF